MGGGRLDSRNPTSKLILTILAGVVTWEREVMLERQREAIAIGCSACGREGKEMIDEEYRGYNLTAVRHSGLWQVSIYPLSVGQIVPKPRGRRTAEAVTREDAFIEARRRVDALLARRAV
jgi:hypothetical protein